MKLFLIILFLQLNCQSIYCLNCSKSNFENDSAVERFVSIDSLTVIVFCENKEIDSENNFSIFYCNKTDGQWIPDERKNNCAVNLNPESLRLKRNVGKYESLKRQEKVQYKIRKGLLKTRIESNTPTVVRVHPGSRAFLLCRVRNLGTSSVLWIFNEDVKYIDTMRITKDLRFKSTFDEPNFTYTMELKVVRPSDQGNYTCQVNSKPILQHMVALQVIPHGTPLLPPIRSDKIIGLGDIEYIRGNISALWDELGHMKEALDNHTNSDVPAYPNYDHYHNSHEVDHHHNSHEDDHHYNPHEDDHHHYSHEDDHHHYSHEDNHHHEEDHHHMHEEEQNNVQDGGHYHKHENHFHSYELDDTHNSNEKDHFHKHGDHFDSHEFDDQHNSQEQDHNRGIEDNNQEVARENRFNRNSDEDSAEVKHKPKKREGKKCKMCEMKMKKKMNKQKQVKHKPSHRHSTRGHHDRAQFDEAVCTMQPNMEVDNPIVQVTGIIYIYKKKDGKGPLHFDYSGVHGLDRGEGVPNTTTHGFHVHETQVKEGKCSTTGSHYNPTEGEHSSPKSPTRHFGDLGNIDVGDRDPNEQFVIMDDNLQLEGRFSIIKRSIVLHEYEDQFTPKKTGGRKIACCTIYKIRARPHIRFNG